MKPKYAVLVIGFITSALTGVLFSPTQASAFSGALQDLPYCQDDSTSGISMPSDFPNLEGEDADFAYSSLPEFDPETSTYLIGYDSEFWFSGYDSQYEKLFIWYTDKNSTNSYLRLDYDTETEQSSVGVVNDSPSPNNEVYYGILEESIEGTRFIQIGSSSGTAWGQRSNISCFEWQQSQSPIDYTENYGSTYPPIDEGGETSEEIRRPHFAFQLNDKQITATPYSPDPPLPDFTPELDEGYSFLGYFINWTVWRCPGDFDQLTGTCSEELQMEDNAFPTVDENYSFTVPEHGNYQVEAEYWAEQCYRYPSYPETPDYCFRSPLRAHFENEPFDYVNTYKNLVVDGRITTGDTKNEVCNVGGYCQTEELICHEIDVFIDKLYCQMSPQLTIGVLNPSITSVKNLLNAILVNTPQCTIPLADIDISGNVFPLSQAEDTMCDSSQQIRTAFPIIPIVVNAIFALSVLAFIIYRVNKLLDNNNHDIVEKV